MKEFDPPISIRSTNELIVIAYGTTEEWQPEAINQAIEELERREVPEEYRKHVLSELSEEFQNFEIAYQKQLKENAKVGYSLAECFFLFLFAPFSVIRPYNLWFSFSELWEESFKRKFKQKLFLLIGGIGFWISVGIISSFFSKKVAYDNEETSNLQDLKKSYYGDDSLLISEPDSMFQKSFGTH